ncbi:MULTISPECIES: hypothetical protein [Streptomyces]|uniref:Uncharacterized protein n=1 Tax=Streptomyces lasiicapitis TaxID=1923961 RepID=A0ABQ2LPN4_9ACTN|nr:MULTISPECIES: hypothetical protein [Streptomyces]QIB47435.1 hypothetical protein G3H79_34490 [Streptomyces aureoverticillatus]GGO41583.1 hypothetical protein GCM10012286_21590 [Streptomyces lasiicapitis]
MADDPRTGNAHPRSGAYEEHFTRTPVQLVTGGGWKRLVAFRVDAEGVLLGGAPARHAAQSAFVSWADITSLVLWRQQTAGEPIDYVGVRRRPGAPLLAGMNSGLSPERTAKLAPHVEHELFLASRPVNLWKLDPVRLQAAVATFAPQVPVHVVQP